MVIDERIFFRCKHYRIDEVIKNLAAEQVNLTEFHLQDQNNDRNKDEKDKSQKKFWDIMQSDKDPFET